MSFLFAQNYISLYQGESISFDTQLTKPDKTYFNLENCTVYIAVKKTITDDYNVIYKTSANPAHISIVTPRTGAIRMFFLTADTKAIAPGKYVYDCWVEDNSTLERFPAIEPSEFQIKPSVFKKS